MSGYRFTLHSLYKLLVKRPELRAEWCIRVIENPVQVETEPGGRIRFWGFVPELGERALRVETSADGKTILTAFLDRRFKP